MGSFLYGRAVGVAVFVALGVIFIPMLFEGDTLDPKIGDAGVMPLAPNDDITSRVHSLDDETIDRLEKSADATTTEAQTDESLAVAEPSGENKVPKLEKEEHLGEEGPIASLVPTNLEAWSVQLGSFADVENAVRLVEKLRQAGYPAYLEHEAVTRGVSAKVHVGPELKRDDAEQLIVKLKMEFALTGILIRYR